MVRRRLSIDLDGKQVLSCTGKNRGHLQMVNRAHLRQTRLMADLCSAPFADRKPPASDPERMACMPSGVAPMLTGRLRR
jgi:hypothetical protein